MQPLLIELGTEELPVKALPGLAQALFDGVIDGLTRRDIAIERGEAKPLYTPRRLAVLLPGIAVEQPQQQSEVLGPYLNIALDADGQPTRALQGFAQKAGVDWPQLQKTSDGKGERFVHRATTPGAKTAALLPEILREAIAAMPIPKSMRWGDHAHAFARPVHWLVLLLGNDVVEGTVLGVAADRMSRGHRFHYPKPVWIGRPDDYIDALRGAKVLADPDERRARIVQQVEDSAQQVGGSARIDPDNLEQVNCLVEWPAAVSCSFDRDFLAVPPEALVATMETNQKFFPVLDADGRLGEHFIGIANIQSSNVDAVRKGYERVIRPRFADAKFFFIQDMEQGLASMNAGLANVTYQAKLGSVADKVARVITLAEAIAPKLGVDPALARRAAGLSKADLQSRLVNEFPELQGIAGRYYVMQDASLQDLDWDQRLAIGNAIDEAYMPRFANDAIAPSRLGQVLAIAERMDTLAGGFAVGLKPTGNKDPFALRRNALGLARVIIEGQLDASFFPTISLAIQQARTAARIIPSKSSAAIHEFGNFILDRLRSYYSEQGLSDGAFEAALGADFDVDEDGLPMGAYTHPLDLDRRLKAVSEFAKLPEAVALAAANKRIRNILRKAEDAIPERVNPALFAEPAERELADAVDAAIADTDSALAQRDYVAVLGRLARLRPQVDAFFEQVMVNVDDPALRDNRLALLQRLADRLGSVAAIEHLST